MHNWTPINRISGLATFNSSNNDTLQKGEKVQTDNTCLLKEWQVRYFYKLFFKTCNSNLTFFKLI